MQGFNIPKQITGGMFDDIVIPSVATNGYAAIWNDTLHKIDWTQIQTVAPGGSSGYIQYNNAGALAGHSGFTYDGAGNVTLSAALVVPVWKPASDSTTALKIKTASNVDAFIFDTTNKYLVCAGNRISYSSLTSQPSLQFSSFEAWLYITTTRSFRFYNNGFTATLPGTVLDYSDPNRALTLTGIGATIVAKTSSSAPARFQIQNSSSAAICDWYASIADNGQHFNNTVVGGYTAFEVAGTEYFRSSAAAPLDVTGTARMDGIRIDVTPTSETVICTHTITFSANGTNYKIPCVPA